MSACKNARSVVQGPLAVAGARHLYAEASAKEDCLAPAVPCRATLFLAVALAGFGCARSTAAADNFSGITLRIRQQMEAGDRSAATDYQARFLGERQFRVEGKMIFSRPKKEQHTLISAGDGVAVRQFEQSPDGLRADIVYMERVRKAVPGYEPALTYDPRAYRGLLADGRAVKAGEETLDGVAVTQYQADLPQGRLSLPANVPLGLPDPAKVRVWICAADGMARRVELEDRAGATFLKVTFSDVRSGVIMDPADFGLKFPEGVKPNDRTEMVIALLSASRIPPAAPGEETREKPADKAAP